MKYFGTDGIRGVVDQELDAFLAYKIGLSIGTIILQNNYEKKVLIGNDTRLSNDLIRYSLACGVIEMGVDCYMLGVVPTACVSYLVRKLNYGFGVMITASHNSWEMNGIKVFKRYGHKCSLSEELEIENKIVLNQNKVFQKGKIIQSVGLVNKYIEHVLTSLDLNLSGISIAIDCANGSNYKIASLIFKKLGAKVVSIACSDNGANINNNCGAEFIDNLYKEVISKGCMFGFAFDGDADRLRVVLANGKILDGDDILYIFATYLKENNRLNNNTVVGTIMSNSGLETALEQKGISLVRVDVGDKNVINCMKEKDYSIGGETSGHIALVEYNPTCDALFNALFFLKIVLQEDYNLDNVLNQLNKLPITTSSIVVSKKLRERYSQDNLIVNSIEQEIDKYRNIARIIIRPSGTEPVFRITVESVSEKNNNIIANHLVEFIKSIE